MGVNQEINIVMISFQIYFLNEGASTNSIDNQKLKAGDSLAFGEKDRDIKMGSLKLEWVENL